MWQTCGVVNADVGSGKALGLPTFAARGPIKTLASDVQPHTLPASSSSNKEVHSSLLVEDEQHVEAAVPATSTIHINA
jgi:hypothetical protein